MLTFSSSTAAPLRLQKLPTGQQLEFIIPADRFAYVYRRTQQEPWRCVARNACSPYIDSAPVFNGSKPEYLVCFCDSAGIIMAATPIVQA
jgi:hypothetical protein